MVLRLERTRRRLHTWLATQAGDIPALASDAGVCTEAVNRWLRGAGWPSAESLFRLRITRKLDLNGLSDITK